MKNPNGYGTIVKLAGNRRKPYACRITIGWKEDGKPKFKYLSYHHTKREAAQALAEYNKNPYSLEKKTFADIYPQWLEFQNYSHKVENKYDNAFKRCAPLHKVYMVDLTLPKLQNFFDNITETKTSVDIMKTMIRSMINFSIKRGLLPLSMKDIMDLVDIVPRKETTEVKREVFSREEISELWKNKEEKYAKLCLFYIYTGLRFAELRNAEWHDNYLYISKAKSKAGIRMVPLSDKAKSLLPLPADLPGHRTYYDCLKYRYNHLPHDTRHTFISMLTEAGVDSRLIKKIVGHATNDVTENVYTHISLETMIEAVNKI